MSKEYQDGLAIENGVFIVDEKTPGFPISARIFQFLAIILGSWGPISVLVESLSIPVRKPTLYLVILITATLMFVFCLIPHYDLIKQFFFFLFYGLFFYSRFPAIQNGFYILENLVLERVASYYQIQRISFIADGTRAVEDTTLLVALIAIPIVSLLSIAVIRSRYVNICSLVLFIPISVSFLIGIIPSEKYLITYVAAVLYLSRSGYSLRHIPNKEQKVLLHRISSRAAVWLSLICVCLFLILKLFISEKEYEGIEEIKTAKSKLQTALFEFSLEDVTKELKEIKLFKSSTAVGGLSGGKLGDISEVTFEGSDQLLVTAPISSLREGVYLKGYVGSVYTGDSWEEHTKSDRKKYRELLTKIKVEEFPPVNQIYLLINGVVNQTYDDTLVTPRGNGISGYEVNQGNLKIEYKGANKKYMYAPYFTDYEELSGTYYEQDLYASPEKRKNSHTFTYYFNLSLGGVSPLVFYQWSNPYGSYSNYEKLYRDFVYEVYTRLPEEGLDRLKKDFSKENQLTVGDSVVDRIEYVQNYLWGNASYTLTPGPLPKDKDFVEYFLYENKEGYCAHFASAATLMLRAMGVPARYVEGYAVGGAQGIQETGGSSLVTAYTEIGSYQLQIRTAEIAVKDYNAHAWVEVYMDGCGWVPVEFTPGSSIEYNASVLEDMEQAGDYMETPDEERPVPTLAPQEPTPVPQNNEDLPNNAEPKPQEPSSNEIEEEKAKKTDALFLILFVVLCIVSTTTTLVLRVRIVRRRRFTRNRNKKAIYLFAEVERLLTFCKGLPGKKTRLEDHEEYVQKHCPHIEVESFAQCMETVRRARFGKGMISYRDLEAVETFHKKLYEAVYQEQPYGKKLLLKLLMNL